MAISLKVSRSACKVRCIIVTALARSPSCGDASRRNSLAIRLAIGSFSALTPAPIAVAAHLAAPIGWIISDTRQQLAGLRCFDDSHGPIAGALCQLRVKRQEEMKPSAIIGIR